MREAPWFFGWFDCLHMWCILKLKRILGNFNKYQNKIISISLEFELWQTLFRRSKIISSFIQSGIYKAIRKFRVFIWKVFPLHLEFFHELKVVGMSFMYLLGVVIVMPGQSSLEWCRQNRILHKKKNNCYRSGAVDHIHFIYIYISNMSSCELSKYRARCCGPLYA